MRPKVRKALCGLTVIAALSLVLSSCAPTPRPTVTATGSDHTIAPQPAAPAPPQVDNTTMAAMEEAAVKAFPAKTQGLGGQVLRPRIVDGVKVFDLTTKAIRWEVMPGQFVDAFAYNGQVPGPEIRVRKGDRIRVVLHNALPESTVIHFHGLTVPNVMDGVPFITQRPVHPGESFTYGFRVVDDPGTYMYHSHQNATEQVGKGLLGAFIVEPPRKAWDLEQTIVVNDSALGFTLNGKGFPATAPISARLGDRVLIRFLNEGQMLHPMHLHGFHFTVIATDGHPVAPYLKDTIVVAPGERYDVVFTANNPGVWAFHCHILSHVEGPQGMYGMVTAVIVK
jgi:FtsP/CotA-like multicopper oxidase with cupredoxin domain